MLYHTVFMQEVQSMKRTLTILSAVLLAAALFMPARALAAGESVEIQVATVNGEVGSTVDVEVSMSNCVGVISTEFDINYDPLALSVVSVTPGNIFPVQYCISYTGNPGRISIACAQALGFTGNGVLLTIRFKIIGDSGSPLMITTHLPSTGATAGTEVTWIEEDIDPSPASAFVVIENGGVTVGEAALPSPSVTPWVPATPIPTPSPTPSITATPEAQEAAALQTIAQQQTTTPDESAPALTSLNPAVYYVGGGLLLAATILLILLLSRKKKHD
jgi:hypothetical protein